MKNFKKIISMLLVFSLLLLLSACGTYNKSNEKDQQNTHTPEDTVEITEAELTDAENGTDKPTEKPTEKATEPQSTDIVINGVEFNSSLKNKLKDAKTYGEICELLKCEGELVGAPTLIYDWLFMDGGSFSHIFVKFNFTEKGLLVCEDFRQTCEEFSHLFTIAKIPDEMANETLLEKSIQEVVALLDATRWSFYSGDCPKFRWTFDDRVTIDVYMSQIYSSYAENEVPDNIYDFTVSFVDVWDSNETNTLAEAARLKITSGQTISEIQEVLGVNAEPWASGMGFTFSFEDDTRLNCHTKLISIGSSDKITDIYVFNGNAQIY